MRNTASLIGIVALAATSMACRPKSGAQPHCVPADGYATCDEASLAAEREALDVTIVSTEARLKALSAAEAAAPTSAPPIQYDVRAAKAAATPSEQDALLTQLDNAKQMRAKVDARLAEMGESSPRGACVVYKDGQVTGVIRGVGENTERTTRRRCDDLRAKAPAGKSLEYRYVEDVDSDPSLQAFVTTKG